MFNLKKQQAKAHLLQQLHHNGQMLILPNIWDPLGALLLEDVGYPAIATASASVAFTNGYDDGEHIPFNDMVRVLAQIANGVSVPVTADMESGFSKTDAELEENIRQIIIAGIVGINIEDSDPQTGALYPVEMQSKKIILIRKMAMAMDVPLFINARTDTYINGSHLKDEEKLQETIKRGHAYINAGADGFYPIAVKNRHSIQKLVSSLPCPVNILMIPGVPDFQTLQEMGVARVSLGPGFLKIAIKAMKDLAIKLKSFNGLDELFNNEVNSEYLKKLVQKN